MKKISLAIAILFLCMAQNSSAQRKCGIEALKSELIAADPSWEQRIEDQRNSLQGIADAVKRAKAAHKTTTVSAIPVIFHVLVTFSQYITLGGNAGIETRIDSQIAVLNRDFNAQNSDLALVPSGWTSRIGNPGIHFALAHTDPSGYGTPGYEISIIPDAPGGFLASSSFRAAKHASSGGFDSWDATRYMNVWCVNATDVEGLLGATVAKSFVSTSGYPLNEVGVCINWDALGKRVSPSDVYIAGATTGDYYDQGRTLTHETGHFFEIWHTWGDDNVYCPWSGPHKDDGLADTPPEGSAKFKNDPYTITGGTYYDTCRYDGTVDTQTILLGVPCLDFMNYTDDIGMHMFTTDQAAVMADKVSDTGENYSLTQNPGLLNWSVKTSVAQLELNNNLNISPNPTRGQINITFNTTAGDLKEITIINTLGREILKTSAPGVAKDYYSIDLSAMSKGIYFVRCNFASGSITRKILLQ